MDEMNAEMRASDADREATVELLRDHAAEGRLSVEELEQRTQAALRAATLGELAPLTADLHARERPREPRRRGRPSPAWGAGIFAAALGSIAVAGEPWVLWFLFALPGLFGKHGSCGPRLRRIGAR